MKVIFLDVDGVLNCLGERARAPSGVIGLNEEKVKLLADLVTRTGAKIVLTSTWKHCWSEKDNELNANGRYLVDKLASCGLEIIAKTSEAVPYNRGQGILDYIRTHKVESFVILDDELFDYKSLALTKYLIQTSFYNPKGGLRPNHIKKAIKILEGK